MKYAAAFCFAWLMVSVFWETFPLNLFHWEGNGFTIYLFAELDRRADLYSFAVMTCQLLTGHKPFERNNTWAMIRSHLEEPPPDPRMHVDMPEIAAQALPKALAKKPEERFACVGEFVAELQRG